MQSRTVAGVLALSLAGGALARAEPARVRLVMRHRVGSDVPAEVVGNLVSSGPDTLTVRTDRSEVVVKRSDVSRVERSLGTRSRGDAVTRGTLVGLGVGALAGGLFGLARGDDGPRPIPIPCLGCSPVALDDYRSRTSSAVHDGAIGALIGGIAGAVYGATAPGEIWRREKADGSAVSLAVQPVGIGARLTLRF